MQKKVLNYSFASIVISLLIVGFLIGANLTGNAISTSGFSQSSYGLASNNINYPLSQIETRIIKGDNTFTLEREFFTKLRIESNEEIKSMLRHELVKSITLKDKEVIVNIDQADDALTRVVISSQGIDFMDPTSYLIQFKEESILEEKLDIERRGGIFTDTDFDNRESKLLSFQEETIEELNKLVNQETAGEQIARIARGEEKQEKEVELKRNYVKVFNGISVKIDPNDLEKVGKSDKIGAIYPDLNVKAFLNESVALTGANLAYSRMNGYKGEGMTIAIIDTGIDYTHPSLGGCFGQGCRVEGGYDFINNDDDPMDDHGHGTHCAGIAAGKINLSARGEAVTEDPQEDTQISKPEYKFYIDEFGLNSKVVTVGSERRGGINFFRIDQWGNEFYGYSRPIHTSDTQNLTVPKSDEFVVSLNNKSHVFGVLWVSDGYVEMVDYANLALVKLNIGDEIYNTGVILSGTDVAGQKAKFQGNGSIDFTKIYDKHGNYMDVPPISDFPATSYDFRIYSPEGELFQEYNFYIEGGEIIGSDTCYDLSPSSSFETESRGEYIGFDGVAPDATLYAYKVLSRGGGGSWSTVIAGIEASIDPNGDGDFSDHMDVISLSLGGNGDPDDPVSLAVDRAVELGVIAVVAAGNDGPWAQTIGSPGTARNALTVGAIDKDNNLAGFSSKGPVVWQGGYLTKPDLVAPGVNICAAQYADAWKSSECLDGYHTAISGTSMATPHVAGGMALLKHERPDLTPIELKALAKFNSVYMADYDVNEVGSGRFNINYALQGRFIPTMGSEVNFGQVSGNSASQRVVLKNLMDTTITLGLSPEAAFDESGNSYDFLTLDKSSLTIPPKGEGEFTATLNIDQDIGGNFGGRIIIDDSAGGFGRYAFSYGFSRNSFLTLVVEGNHYPNFIIHDSNMDIAMEASQGYNFVGNTYTFTLPAGEYTVYAINDFLGSSPETTEYVLVDKVNIGNAQEITKTLSLNDARKFTVKARDTKGDEIYLYEWVRAVNIYKQDFKGCWEYWNQSLCEDSGKLCTWIGEDSYCQGREISLGYFDPTFGDREIYLSNKPDNGFETDIVLRYLGAPEGEISGLSNLL